MPRLAVLISILVSLTVPVLAAQPQFWKIEGSRDFLDGDTNGLSVDSLGRVRLAPESRRLHDPDAPYVWSLASDGKGAIFAGTGNDGRIFRVLGGKGTLLYDSPELEVHALVVGPDGRLYAGTSPEGRVYAIDRDGKAVPFFDPEDKYIWALAFDRAGNLLVATGGSGRLLRVDPQGKATVLFTSAETHLTALALDGSGTAYLGSAPSGVLFRMGTDGKVFVLHDSSYREIKSLAVGADGSVYAAAQEGRDAERGGAPAPVFPISTTTATPSTEVTVTETFSLGAVTPLAAPSPRAPEPVRGGAAKGAVFRVLPSGEVDTIWTSADESPHALLARPDGVVVGTGNRGKLYHLRNDRTWTMLDAFGGEQVTALFDGVGGRLTLATSNPARVHEVGGALAAKGTFQSKPRDTETVSAWGQLRWEGTTPSGTTLRIETRSGNTGTPDSTWAEWSALPAGAREVAIASARARYLQLRVTLLGAGGQSPVLDTLSAAYLQRNLRPQVQSITVHAAGEVFQKPLSLTGETEILGLDPVAGERPATAGAMRAPALPAATTYSRKMFQKGLQTFSWRADDPNGDSLLYDVHYRSLGDPQFRLLKKGLSEAVLAWDTSTVPNGRYLVRVTSSDAASNPEGLALTADRESVPFEVDNTPPIVTGAHVSANRVRAVVKDDSSIVRRAEYSVDGGRWQDVHPVDGINDATEETFEIEARDLTGPGPHIVMIRATDLLGNVATGRVVIP